MSVIPLNIDSRQLKRLQFDVAEEEVRELERLVVECGLSTRKDLFNNAITLLRWVARETKKGNEIASVDNESEQLYVLHMPILDALRRHSEFYEGNPTDDPTVRNISTPKTRRKQS